MVDGWWFAVLRTAASTCRLGHGAGSMNAASWDRRVYVSCVAVSKICFD